MVVNSLNFLYFFVVVFIVYYLPVCKKNPKFQNIWTFLASYFFYGVADWKMLPLLLGSTVVFYILGLWLARAIKKEKTKKASRIKTIGVVIGVGILLYFKYLNFFADSFAELLSAIGLNVSWTTLNIVLPIGVSFFTFKLISYIIEIHREHIVPCKDFIEFGTYIAFFPTILSGPIDRPNSLIPQLSKPRSFDHSLAVDGCRQILWGMFTKMCIADRLATMTDGIWSCYANYSGPTLILCALLYFIQMYADFDGYSNMAIGVGKLLGIKIARNFNHPLLARNMAEYWRRWHMSLTSWITDYIFMPLNIAFRSWGSYGVILACTINLVVIGLWHGANWTYGLFGIYHAALFVPLILSGAFGKNKKLKATKTGLPKFKDLSMMFLTFLLVSLGLVIFRAPSVSDALQYIRGFLDWSVLKPAIGGDIIIWPFIALLLIVEWLQRDKEHALQTIKAPAVVRWFVYIALTFIIITCQGAQAQFIYFGF